MWYWVRKYQCGRQWPAFGFLWLGGPFWLAGLESVRKRKQVSLWSVIRLTRLLQLLKDRERKKERERDTEPNSTFFFPREELGLSIPGIATAHQTIHTLSLQEWMATVCVRLTAPSSPCRRRAVGAAGSHSEPRLSLRPEPPSQTPARLRRLCWATAQAGPRLEMHSRK